jgi:repressor LexA
MTPQPTTPRQREVYNYICKYAADNAGMIPTGQEIADDLGVSKVTIHEHIHALERKGWLKRHPHKARGISVNGCCPTCGRAIEDQTETEPMKA